MLFFLFFCRFEKDKMIVSDEEKMNVIMNDDFNILETLDNYDIKESDFENNHLIELNDFDDKMEQENIKNVENKNEENGIKNIKEEEDRNNENIKENNNENNEKENIENQENKNEENGENKNKENEKEIIKEEKKVEIIIKEIKNEEKLTIKKIINFEKKFDKKLLKPLLKTKERSLNPLIYFWTLFSPKKMIEVCGLEAYLFENFNNYFNVYYSLCMIVIMSVLLPISLTQHDKNFINKYIDVARFTIASYLGNTTTILANIIILYFIILSMFIFSFLTKFLIPYFIFDITNKKKIYNCSSYCVMINGIPKSCDHKVTKKIEEYLNETFGEEKIEGKL
jgi:hypothetical protein